MELVDEEGNKYQLVPAPAFNKDDRMCSGCTVRAQSQIPGGQFCISLGNYKCQSLPGKHVWKQVYWGNYSKGDTK